jgi:glutamine amidotransferase
MSKAIVGIVDYNTGNIASVKNAFLKIGIDTKIVSCGDELLKCDKLLLPGVGAFGDAMEHLRENSLDEAIAEFAKSGKYMMGICLGAQVLFKKGYEFGEHKGLGLIDGEVIAFDKSKTDTLKIPHMGWNTIEPKEDRLFANLPDKSYFYFVHSYHIKCDDKYTLAYSEYGYNFASVIKKDNIYGIQPHPEKSDKNGLEILKNFGEL